MDITRHILYLISRYDYVVLPGFGGFVMDYQPANVHPVTHEMRPPSRRLAFNRQLAQDDGLLVTRIAKRESVSTDAARDHVRSQVQQWQQAMERHEIVVIEEIGKFWFDPEQRLVFSPGAKGNLLPSAFGLPEMRTDPVLRARVVDIAPAVPIPIRSQAPVRKRPIRPMYWAAASIALLIIAALGTYLSVPSVQQHTNTVFGWDTSYHVKPNYSGLSLEPARHAHWTRFVPLHIPEVEELTEEVPVLTTESLEYPLTVEANHELPKGYFVIVGSFTKAGNAGRFHTQLTTDGYDAHTFPQTQSGFMRVGIFVSDTGLVAANRHMRSIRQSLQQDAWILKNVE